MASWLAAPRSTLLTTMEDLEGKSGYVVQAHLTLQPVSATVTGHEEKPDKARQAIWCAHDGFLINLESCHAGLSLLFSVLYLLNPPAQPARRAHLLHIIQYLEQSGPSPPPACPSSLPPPVRMHSKERHGAPLSRSSTSPSQLATDPCSKHAAGHPMCVVASPSPSNGARTTRWLAESSVRRIDVAFRRQRPNQRPGWSGDAYVTLSHSTLRNEKRRVCARVSLRPTRAAALPLFRVVHVHSSIVRPPFIDSLLYSLSLTPHLTDSFFPHLDHLHDPQPHSHIEW